MKKPLSCLDSSSFVFLPHHGYSNHPTLTSGPSAGRNDSLHRRPVRLRRYKRWAEDTTPMLEALSPSHVQLSKTLTCREAGFSVCRQTCFFLSTIAAGLYGSLDKFCVFWHTVLYFVCFCLFSQWSLNRWITSQNGNSAWSLKQNSFICIYFE